MKKVHVPLEERKLPYYKYFERDMAPIGEKQKRIIEGGEATGGKGLPFSDINIFVADKDDDYCQIGYGVMPDGIGYACNTLYLPGVTGAMMDWWNAWNSVGPDLRYKIWHPYCHYFQRNDNPERILDPNVPIKEKIWGTNYVILESVGVGGTDIINMSLRNPVDVGVDSSLIGSPSCEGLTFGGGSGEIAAISMEKWAPHRDGIILKSRFWIGMKLNEDGKVVRGIDEDLEIPEFIPGALFKHCVEEYTNLGSFLAELYYEQDGKIE